MIAIVDYGVGNLQSVANMFRKAGVQSTMRTVPGTKTLGGTSMPWESILRRR